MSGVAPGPAALVVTAALVAAVATVSRRKGKKKQGTSREDEAEDEAVARWVELNLVRKSRLGSGVARDYGSSVVLVEDASFDLNKTIFQTVRSPVSRVVLQARLRLQPYWNEAAAAEIAATSLPRAPAYAPPLLDFMNTECCFSMEHADGSFMDHLQFCYEYCSAHFARESPNVLLLHSVLGVGTNYFPCTVDKIPRLEQLLSPTEFRHVEAFPSVLRLILRRAFLRDLDASPGATKVAFFRVIDNKPITLDIDTLWVHLNYHLIHLLDFLPLTDWRAVLDNDYFLAPFVALHDLLKRHGKLRANVAYDLTDPGPTDKVASLSLGQLIADYVPSALQTAIGARQIAQFSKAIGHDLSYTFHYD